MTKALSLAPNHVVAHNLLGVVQITTNRAAQGIAECEQALALDRNLANAQGSIGYGKYLLGRGEETEAHVHEALRLSPRDIVAHRWLHIGGVAKLLAGADAEAVVAWFQRSIEANRSFHLAHFFLAAALALVGQLDQARAATQAGLTLDPTFTIRRYRVNTPSNNPIFPAARQRLYEGMRMAGVPEG